MKITGKILFFNATEGKGILITSQKEKIAFNVAVWNDFDIMPSLGLEVRCLYENNEIVKIVSVEHENELEDELEEQTIEVAQENAEEPLSESDTIEKEQEDSVEEEQHFIEREDIELLKLEDALEDELPPREESLNITLNLSKAVVNYFTIIKNNIDKREKYTRVDGRLNYLLIRRFLWTTFNNVSELDLHIITPKVKALSDDLKEMSRVYDDFMRKIKYPPLAYEEVFLSCQDEYLRIRSGAQKTIEKLNALKNNEKYIGEVLKVKKEELNKNIKSHDFDILQEEFKSMNGAYVDVVHMMAELDERYKHDMKLLIDFEKEYRADFYELFKKASQEYKRDIIDILSAQAYILDTELWQKAKTSKAIKAHFHKAGISGSFNTKTYLKYYLDTLDSSKMTDETKKLYDLYEYLSSIYKECIMIVSSNVNDAMDYETSIKTIDKIYEVKAFIDEKAALKWALQHSVKVLVLEDNLAKMRAETFLQYYKKYILLIPKIIILGNSVNSSEYAITKLLASNISSRRLTDHVKELIKI